MEFHDSFLITRITYFFWELMVWLVECLIAVGRKLYFLIIYFHFLRSLKHGNSGPTYLTGKMSIDAT